MFLCVFCSFSVSLFLSVFISVALNGFFTLNIVYWCFFYKKTEASQQTSASAVAAMQSGMDVPVGAAKRVKGDIVRAHTMTGSSLYSAAPATKYSSVETVTPDGLPVDGYEYERHLRPIAGIGKWIGPGDGPGPRLPSDRDLHDPDAEYANPHTPSVAAALSSMTSKRSQRSWRTRGSRATGGTRDAPWKSQTSSKRSAARREAQVVTLPADFPADVLPSLHQDFESAYSIPAVPIGFDPDVDVEVQNALDGHVDGLDEMEDDFIAQLAAEGESDYDEEDGDGRSAGGRWEGDYGAGVGGVGSDEGEEKDWDSDGPAWSDDDFDDAASTLSGASARAARGYARYGSTLASSRRSGKLGDIDDQFENLLIHEYDEEEWGALEEDEENGHGGTLDDYQDVLDDFMSQAASQSVRRPGRSDAVNSLVAFVKADPDMEELIRAYGEAAAKNANDKPSVIQQKRRRAQREAGAVHPEDHPTPLPIAQGLHEIDDDGEEGEEDPDPSGGANPVLDDIDLVEEDAELAWDVESVLSTVSNTDNIPNRLGVPKAPPKRIMLHKRTGMPMGVFGPPGKARAEVPVGASSTKAATKAQRVKEAAAAAAAANEEAEEDEEGSEGEEVEEEEEEEVENLGAARPKGESKEDKKARKAAVKEARRLARQNKKSLKVAFKTELNTQARLASNHAHAPKVRLKL